MAKEYACPACKNPVDPKATVCSTPSCRAELAFCSHCRDVTTYTFVAHADGRFARDRWRCDRCERLGVKCRTWLMGGYCNGLARAAQDGNGWDKQLCANCTDRVSEASRTIVSWSLIGALGSMIRPRR
jgi:hypothetical protein